MLFLVIANFCLMKNNNLTYLQLFLKYVSYNISIQWLSVLSRNTWIFNFLGTEMDGWGNDKRTKYKRLQEIFLN